LFALDVERGIDDTHSDGSHATQDPVSLGRREVVHVEHGRTVSEEAEGSEEEGQSAGCGSFYHHSSTR
jgi:hypothetical protein